MASIRDIVFDSPRPSVVARFWAAALDGYQVAAYGQPEIARLAALGVHDVADDPSVLVEPVDGLGPRLFFQRVPEGRVAKNRVHLDLRAPDHEVEVTRLVGLGGRVLTEHEGWTVLADVDGNELCVLR